MGFPPLRTVLAITQARLIEAKAGADVALETAQLIALPPCPHEAEHVLLRCRRLVTRVDEALASVAAAIDHDETARREYRRLAALKGQN